MLAQQNALDRYKVIRELGRGAIGTVYAARDRSTGAVVALKTLDPALFGESDANLAELFLKNARSAGRLRHRNIVKIHDAGEAGGTVYVAMELLVGESLRNMLDNRPLSISRAIQIFDDIASALAYAHEEGIVHRGVRPSNIMVLRSGVAKIGDFGIGQIGEAARRYMSPDQGRGTGAGPGTGAGSGEPTARLPGGAEPRLRERCKPIARPRGAARSELPATRSDKARGAPACDRTRTRPADGRSEPIPRPRPRGRLGGTRPDARSAWTYRLLVLLARPKRVTHRDPYARSAGDSRRCAGRSR